MRKNILNKSIQFHCQDFTMRRILSDRYHFKIFQKVTCSDEKVYTNNDNQWVRNIKIARCYLFLKWYLCKNYLYRRFLSKAR